MLPNVSSSMRWLRAIGCVILAGCPAVRAAAQVEGAASVQQPPGTDAVSASLPDVGALLGDVERNQKRLEATQRDYTYHVHTEEQELDKNGGVKKTETEEAESLTIGGIRVNKVVARDGKPLSPEEQTKESERIDKEVARAKERQSKLEAKGADTDPRGNEVMPLSRILELGSFTNLRRVQQEGRSLILVDYAGNPQAKTHSAFEGIMRDVVGTLAIDETDRVLVRAEGHFLNDFKLGGGLMADVHKGSSFAYRATRVSDGMWLPATIDGQGSIRVLLFAHFSGRLHLTTSDYRRFRASATIVGSNGAIGPDGTPLPDQASPGGPPRAPAPKATAPEDPHPQP